MVYTADCDRIRTAQIGWFQCWIHKNQSMEVNPVYIHFKLIPIQGGYQPESMDAAVARGQEDNRRELSPPSGPLFNCHFGCLSN